MKHTDLESLRIELYVASGLWIFQGGTDAHYINSSFAEVVLKRAVLAIHSNQVSIIRLIHISSTLTLFDPLDLVLNTAVDWLRGGYHRIDKAQVCAVLVCSVEIRVKRVRFLWKTCLFRC